jgi:UDP-N-acetyl-D-glucosamine dehydrogenase
MRIAVVGLGKIGLPLAAQFSSAGNDVVGIDIDARVVDEVNAGREPFPGEAGLQQRLDELIPTGRLRATTSFPDAVGSADVVVVVVPLHVDDATWEPDFRAMDSATRDIGASLRPGTLVVYETTLPVGTTRNRFGRRLSELSGLVEGEGYYLAFSPERVLTGRVFSDLQRYPKLIGGVSEAAAARARAFYEQTLDFDERADLSRPNGVWDLGSAEAAEMAKLAETTYRDVNIALANQFALYAATEGIDIHQVIEASNSQPYSHLHRPGIAVGGHCIPVYPRLYLANDPGADLVRTARNLNAAMPEKLVQQAEDLLGDLRDRRAVVLGAAYRGGAKETAFSGVFPVVRALRERGARVVVSDPLYSATELEALGLTPYEAGGEVDVVVLQTDHPEYSRIGPADFPGVRLLVDGRNATDPARWAGVARIVVGAPATR